MSAYSAAVLADNPTNYWRCADPGGVLVHDIGSARKSLLFNGLIPTGLPYSGPVSDGGSMVIQQASYPWYKDGLNVALPLSLECWGWLQGGVGSAQYLMTLASGTFYGALSIDGTLHPQGQAPGAGLAVTGAAAITVQRWHHYVLTVSAAGVATLYYDAFSQGSIAGTAVGGSFAAIALGGLSASFGNGWSGGIAECAVYPSLLSPSQVTTHFVAADNTAGKPIWLANGVYPTGTGGSTSSAQDIQDILSSVRHTYPAT